MSINIADARVRKSASLKSLPARGTGMVLAALLLVGCEETTEGSAAKPPPTPPEYLQCKYVPEALAQADAVVRELGLYNDTEEGTFWVKRQERLIARAYECK